MRRLLLLLVCVDLCGRLLYDSGTDRGFTESCVCCENGECDVVSKKTFPPLPITLKIRNKSGAKEPVDQTDDRPALPTYGPESPDAN